ncbi:hypothetical protein CHS0354_008607 [Potamilus streckersoni]|uniref:Uncharacterized protein n=1 Tax=Potamilus streckersoni TaxID=2493646 RepID=A0AAE0W2P3_9BIVA|nr:hypothetical protein CHS0354_008607 [Potamilus streckersoni]
MDQFFEIITEIPLKLAEIATKKPLLEEKNTSQVQNYIKSFYNVIFKLYPVWLSQRSPINFKEDEQNGKQSRQQKMQKLPEMVGDIGMVEEMLVRLEDG